MEKDCAYEKLLDDINKFRFELIELTSLIKLFNWNLYTFFSEDEKFLYDNRAATRSCIYNALNVIDKLIIECENNISDMTEKYL